MEDVHQAKGPDEGNDSKIQGSTAPHSHLIFTPDCEELSAASRKSEPSVPTKDLSAMSWRRKQFDGRERLEAVQVYQNSACLTSSNVSDRGRPSSLSNSRSPSTELTNLAMSSDEGSATNSISQEPATADATVIDSDERLLDPAKYFRNLASLKSAVLQNSAVCCYKDAENLVSSRQPANEVAFSSDVGSIHSLSAAASMQRGLVWNHQPRLQIRLTRVQSASGSTDDDFWMEVYRRTTAHQIFDLLECRNLITRICNSLSTLQKAEFCTDRFSFLVIDEDRAYVAILVPVYIAFVEELKQLFETALIGSGGRALSYSATQSGSEPAGTDPRAVLASLRRSEKTVPTFDYQHSEDLTAHCSEFLTSVHLKPHVESAPELIWRCTVHLLDLALVSYIGAHTESSDAALSEGSQQVTIPGPFTPQAQAGIAAGAFIIMRRRKMLCIDNLLRQRDVWVFHRGTDAISEVRLLLSTDVETISDIWGPLWKMKAPNSSGVSRYSIGNGFIIPSQLNPWREVPIDTKVRYGTEVFCHWISCRDWEQLSNEEEQSFALADQFYETERLLIGAHTKDRLEVNVHCDDTTERKLRLKERLRDSGNLRVRRVRKSRRERDLISYQVQAGAAGFASVGSTIAYKRHDGYNWKDALLDRWRNGDGNLKELELHGGVEVSWCTQNARRRPLSYILRSSGMRKYLKTISFQWKDEECETGYFEALETPAKLRIFWNTNRNWQETLRKAIFESLRALEDTGVDEKDGALSVLWVEKFDDLIHQQGGQNGGDKLYRDFDPAEEHIVTLRRSEHSWTEFLQDSPVSLTMAILGDTCLDFDDAYEYGMRCRAFARGESLRVYGSGYSVLQIGLLVNERLLKSDELTYESSKRKRKQSDCGDRDLIPEDGQIMCASKRRKARKEHQSEVLTCHSGCELENLTGGWNTSRLKKHSRFNLGARGELKVYKKPACHQAPVLMEWRSVLNDVSQEMKDEFMERTLGKCGEICHSEYQGYATLRKPLQCLIISDKKPRD